MRALLVREGGAGTVIDIVPALETLQHIVGGYVESLHIHGDWVALINEDGRSLGLAPNPAATRVLVALGWRGGVTVVGPVLFVGLTLEGEDADVTGEVLSSAKELGVIS